MTPHSPGPDDSSPAPNRQAIPPTVGRYRLIRRIGRGGSGVVYRADDGGRAVAVKLIAAPAAARPQLLRAARAAGRLRHPNLVALHAAGSYPGGVYLAMELVAGRSVQAILDRRPLGWRAATATLIAACEGVLALHAHGLLHRDLKPANLLCAADGAVKVADLGLACRPGPPRPPAGTPHFASPEQCRGDPLDERADVYALGATYFTLLTGRPPYPGTTPWQTLFAHCAAPVPDPCRARPGVPVGCAAVVARAMAKARADRFPDVCALREALLAVAGGGAPAWRT